MFNHRGTLSVLLIVALLAPGVILAQPAAPHAAPAPEAQAGVTGNVHTLSNAYKQLVGVTSETPQYEGWASGFYLPGLDSTVRALVLDSNGHLYAGGSFTKAGGVNARMIAKWDGESWSALGSGMGGVDSTGVYALAVDQAGNLYAGGDFTTAGGVSVNHVARWDGTSWSLLGAGIGGDHYAVHALAIDSDNNVYAAANYDWYGTCHTILAKWDGVAWTTISSGGGFADCQEIEALAVDQAGNLYAGGYFTTIGGVNANRIAKWNGSFWSPLGSGIDGHGVRALAVDSSSAAVYAGGYFSAAGGIAANNVARWNGTSWSPLGGGLGGSFPIVYGLALSHDGATIYAGGWFTTAGAGNASYIALWNGSTWSPLASGMDSAVLAVTVDQAGNLHAGGDFTTAGGMVTNHASKWDGTRWSGIDNGNGVVDEIFALAADRSSSVFAGGDLHTADGLRVDHIARWSGSSWSALSNGTNARVNAIAIDQASAAVYAGGEFTAAGGISAQHIAKWNGSSWSALGDGMNGNVNAMAVDQSGNVYAGGSFTMAGGVTANRIAKWNGSSWSALGNGTIGGGYPPTIGALAVDQANNLYAGGWFTTVGGVSARNVAMWNPSTGTWSALGGGTDYEVFALATDPSGNLYAGGWFTTAGGVSANRIAKWNGSSWSALGSGIEGSGAAVRALTLDSAGRLYTGGHFTSAGGASANNAARWDGTSWSAMGSGIDGAEVNGLVVDVAGNLYAGGGFEAAGGIPSNNIARWTGTANPQWVWHREAEDVPRTGGMQLATDNSGASACQYVYYTGGEAGSIPFNVTVPYADNYFLWARAMGTGWTNNSFFVSVDGGTWSTTRSASSAANGHGAGSKSTSRASQSPPSC